MSQTNNFNKWNPFNYDLRLEAEEPWPAKGLSKQEILNPKKPRDYMINLFFAKPDYEEPIRKVYYSTYTAVKLSIFYSGMACIGMPSLNPKLAAKTVARSVGFVGNLMAFNIETLTIDL